ncbi:MAG: response regulator [Deltaproteobacteria bacterium]|nr:response regulator [Deltaproteobacteria bacterium]
MFFVPKILVVDDDPLMCGSLKELLTRQGYEVTACTSGREALELISRVSFDLALLDIVIPDISGYGVMDYIQRHSPQTLVVTITGYVSVESVLEVLRRGAYDYLKKPFELEELLKVIENATNHKRLESERKRAEDALRESEERYRTLVENIDIGITLMDARHTIIMTNSAQGRMFENSPSALVGNKCYREFRRRDAVCSECPGVRAMAAGLPAEMEREIIKKDGSRSDLKVHAFPTFGKDGTVSGFIYVIEDITEAKLLQRQLATSEKLASLGLLMSGIAHEINNPNNFISFNIPILRDYLKELLPIMDKHAEKRPNYQLFGMSYPEFRRDLFRLLDNLEHGSNRISATISSLNEFARESSQDKGQWIDLRHVIDKGVAICRGEIKKRVKSFELDVQEGLSPVYTNPEALEQILINLLINAAQAMDKDGSWVKLSIRDRETAQDELIIEVSDNGCGIEEGHIRKIFDPFYTTKGAGVGTGLGLYVCHSIVEREGWRIEVESQAGIGSKFRLVLPRTTKHLWKNEHLSAFCDLRTDPVAVHEEPRMAV